MDRSSLQRNAADMLIDSRRLMCQWCTGLGKSGVVLEYLKKRPSDRVLIVVPEVDNIENWRGEFKKFKVNDIRVLIICYNSLKKYTDTKWDLLVLDEVPHVDTQKRLSYCSTITATNVLALGAVISEEEKISLESMYGDFKKSRLSLDWAIENNILPKPDVRILHLKLNDTDKTVLYNGHKVTELERYRAYETQLEKAKEAYAQRPNDYTQQALFRAGNARKRFLGHLKEEKLRTVCEKLTEKGRRFLCFCASIKQAESIGGEYAYTSHTPASARLLERFNNHEINSLFVVGKLIEGQTLNDIEAGVIGQLGGENRITVQACGRIMRSKNPLIYALTFDGTKDDSFLRTLTESIPEDYIKHYNY